MSYLSCFDTTARKFRHLSVWMAALAVLLLAWFAGSVQAEVQHPYSAIAKIIGHGDRVQTNAGQSQAVYYGSGVYAAESGELGIVLTNWHVVCSSEGLLDIRFPTFRSPGAVILADDVWDIAAVVVHKPPFVPVPISLEVPQIGDELWVGGYGSAPGLEEFQLSSGPVLSYSIIDYSAFAWLKEPLPGETLMVGTAVRFGDSGGPILNRYGELAGLLWGSDGNLTMGSFCLRIQAFLTQAQFQLAHRPSNAQQFFTEALQNGTIKKISIASTPAQQALKRSGVFPISSVPVYTPPRNSRVYRDPPKYYKPATTSDIQSEEDKGRPEMSPSPDFIRKRDAYLAAHRNGYTLPPYPPIESPTLLAQRHTIGRDHPEVYPDGMNQPRVVVDSTADGSTALVSGQKTVEQQTTNQPAPGTANQRPETFQNASLNQQQSPTVMSPVSNEIESGGVEGTSAPSDQPEEEKRPLRERIPGLRRLPLTDIQVIIVVVAILFLFVNSLRLISLTIEKPKTDKKK